MSDSMSDGESERGQSEMKEKKRKKGRKALGKNKHRQVCVGVQ